MGARRRRPLSATCRINKQVVSHASAYTFAGHTPARASKAPAWAWTSTKSKPWTGLAPRRCTPLSNGLSILAIVRDPTRPRSWRAA